MCRSGVPTPPQHQPLNSPYGPSSCCHLVAVFMRAIRQQSHCSPTCYAFICRLGPFLTLSSHCIHEQKERPLLDTHCPCEGLTSDGVPCSCHQPSIGEVSPSPVRHNAVRWGAHVGGMVASLLTEQVPAGMALILALYSQVPQEDFSF